VAGVADRTIATADALVDALFALDANALALLDPDLRIMRANESFRRLAGDRRTAQSLDDLRPSLAACAREVAARARDGRAPARDTVDHGDVDVVCNPVVADGSVSAVVLALVPSARDDDAGNDSRLDRVAAEELQRALLPAVLPALATLDVAARYVPARGQVGGDWYDVLRLADGRVALVVGDVVGHGVPAAAAMGALRYALLVFASETADPGRLLERLNRFAAKRGTDAGTIAIAVVDSDADELTVASAGHVPVLVRRADGTVHRHGVQLGIPLGVLAATEYRTETATFEPGDAVVLFTDGVVERRGEAIDVGLDRLDAVVASAPATPERVADAVLGATLVRQDDAAVLVAKRPATTGFVFSGPAEPSQLPLLRQLFDRWLTARGLGAAVRAEMLLALGEAAANAVEHAYGPGALGQFRARAAIEGSDRLEIVVSDDGRWRGRQPPGGGRGLELLRALVDEIDIDRRPDGTTVTLRRFLPEGMG
jgi:anti-sigma regulatory factor (Ser/Thr protein kinase)